MLNAKQLKATNLPAYAPALVIAGAGSGKTTVLTNRIYKLASVDLIPPHTILAVTFTRKAANELKARCAQLDSRLAIVRTGTFHSAAIEIMRDLRSSAIDTPLSRATFTIMDSKDQKNLVKSIVEAHPAPAGLFEEKKDAIDACVRFINARKEDMQRAADVVVSDWNHVAIYAFSIYQYYEALTLKQNLFDFTEILFRLYLCLRDHKPSRDYISSKINHILIDEYQDTNALQSALVDMLLNGSSTITAVGDDDQSIYRWRGAKTEYILEFEKNYKGVNIVTLEENYRSTQSILTAANNVIKNNEERHEKVLFSNIESSSDDISLTTFSRSWDEAESIAESIKEQMDQGRQPKDFAILFRSNFQTLELESVFGKHGLPYRLTGGTNFFERVEIKAVMAYLKLTINPNDSSALATACAYPKRRIGEKILKELQYKSATTGLTLVEALGESKSKGCIALFECLNKLTQMNSSLEDIIETTVHDSGIFQHFSDLRDVDKADATKENLLTLIANASRYAENCTVEEFLEQAALTAEGNKKGDENNAISFSTIHGAKGLEYPVVYLIGLSENTLPHKRSIMENDVSEERRLAYVAITRAKEKLHLSNYLIDRSGSFMSCSRFITEMQLDIEHINHTGW